MAPTKGFTAAGLTLSIGSGGAGETFTAILQIKQFAFSGVTTKYEDLTNLGSPAVGSALLEEAIPSTVSPGTATFSGVFLPSDPGQSALAAAFATQALTDFKLQLPKGPGQTVAGNLYAFSAFIQDMPLPDSLDTNKAIMLKIVLKLNTLPVLTAGS